MVKKLFLTVAVAMAALTFAGVRPSDIKQEINTLSQQSSQSMMGNQDDYWTR